MGWSTSSIRHRNELPKVILKPDKSAELHVEFISPCFLFQRQHFTRNEKYPHIVNEEVTKISSPQQEVPLKVKGNGCKSIDMEGLLPICLFDKLFQAILYHKLIRSC